MPQELQCQRCGRTYLRPPSRAVESRYCSNPCRLGAMSEARSRKAAERRAAEGEGQKRCRDCGVVKPYEEFSPFKANKDGRYSYCRPCSAKKSVGWAKQNRGKINARRTRRRAIDPAYAEAERLRSRESYARNREQRNAVRMLRQWNITMEQFDALLESQGGGCAICGVEIPNGHGERHGIDHDHSCCAGQSSCGGCIRGILCSRCNAGLGNFDDRADRLIAAAVYLNQDKE